MDTSDSHEPTSERDPASEKAPVRVTLQKENYRVDLENVSPAPRPSPATLPIQWTAPETSSAPRMLSTSAEPPRPAEPVSRTESIHVEEAAPKSSGPLKSISVQVGQSGQQKVEVHFTTRSGDLYVGVRSGDTEIARGLREGLPELVSRLDESGYRSEGWRPSGMVNAAAEHSPSRPSSPDQGNNDSRQQPGSSQQDRDQANQNRSQRPKWLEEFEGNPSGGKQFQGEIHGFSD